MAGEAAAVLIVSARGHCLFVNHVFVSVTMHVFKFDRWTFSGPLALAHRLRVALQPKQESLKKVLDGQVALMDGGQESSLPGGEAEAKFCCSLSRLLNLDEVNRHVMLEAALVALCMASFFSV